MATSAIFIPVIISLSCILIVKGKVCHGPKISVFDRWQNKCVCEIGVDNCNICGTNAYEEDYGVPVCRCMRGYTVDKEGICHPSHKTKCGNNAKYPPCNPKEGLICVDKRCECKQGQYEYFTEEVNRCYAFVDSPCGENGTICTPNAECEKLVCKCKDGYKPVDGLCELGYGQPCNDLIEDSEEFPGCDKVGGLRCIGGVCKCETLQVYDEKEEKCVGGSLGSFCEVRAFLQGEDSCVNGATCKPIRSFTKFNRGICTNLTKSQSQINGK